jgi:hypothetical protein
MAIVMIANVDRELTMFVIVVYQKRIDPRSTSSPDC